jgi:hypothetical protein
MGLMVGLLLTLVPLAAVAQPVQVEDPIDACPDDVNPPAPFVDRADIPDVHVLNVDCAFNNDITRGYDDATFRPRLDVQRDQFASFLVRTMEAADVDLPEPQDQGFEDIDGNVHADNIDILAQTGITQGITDTRFGPELRLRRDQVASFVLRAAAFIEDVPLENLQRDDGPFEDVTQDNVHRTNINGGNALNLVLGRTDTELFPDSATKRDQMASFLIRLLAALTSEEGVVPPELRATQLELTPQTATNPAGTEHTVTAEVTDTDGGALENVDVRLEVYRDDASTDEDTFTGPEHTDEGETTADGRLSFTYTGPEFDADDQLVACVLDPGRETCMVEGGDAFEGEAEAGARVHDTARATWDDSAVDRIEIDEGDRFAVNPLGTDHTVSATVTDPDGAGVEGATIRFEVYRGETDIPAVEDDGDLDDVTFSGPVEEIQGTTDGDGRIGLTYTGPDEDAADRIVICRPVRDDCLVVDEEPDSDDTRFTGDPEVGAEPNAVATKLWDSRLQPAEYARASAIGATVDGEGSPEVTVEATDGDDERRVTGQDEAGGIPASPLADAGLLEVDALVDLDLGIARGEAKASDVDLVIDEDGLGLAPGTSVLSADVIHAQANATCPVDGDWASDEALEAASAGTYVAGLAIAGEGFDGEPEPNTVVPPEDLGPLAELVEVTLRETTVIHDGDDEIGYRVRGVVVELFGEVEIAFGDAEAEVRCAEIEPGDGETVVTGGDPVEAEADAVASAGGGAVSGLF